MGKSTFLKLQSTTYKYIQFVVVVECLLFVRDQSFQEVNTFKPCFLSEFKTASALDYHGFSLLKVFDWAKARCITTVSQILISWD